MATHNINFSPRVLYEALGYKNIEVDSIAFAEQIKNSYDAKSKNIILDFSDYHKDKIRILDDGIGMNEKELIENWLLVGTQSKIFDEKALGGKGVGRFSLFRIANTITVISKKKNYPEYQLRLEKNSLEKLDYLENSKVEIMEEKVSKYFKSEPDSGTLIILTDLKQLNMLEIFYDLYNLIQPNKFSNFPVSINYIYPSSFKKPYVMPVEDALKYAPFACKACFKSNNLIEYKFICQVKEKILYKNNNAIKLSHSFKKLMPIDLGEIEFYLYNYYFDPTFTSLLSIPQNNIQNDYLNIYQGISVYRESFKIYGHGKTDWLNLAEKRVADPTRNIDNKLSFGYISLKRPNSDSLEEKTSRESFIKGEELNYFKKSISLIIDNFNKDRVNSIDIIRNGERKNDFKIIHEIIQNNIDGKISEQIGDNNNEASKSHITDIKSNIVPSKSEYNNQSNIQNELHNDSNQKQPQVSIEKPKPKYSDMIIIDPGFECIDTVPEKIKRIIYELQTLKNTEKQPTLYSQALLLRCLIDISTQYVQEKLSIETIKNDLLGNILKVLNYASNKALLPAKVKHIKELRILIKEDETIKYFNGIVHDYDFKTHYQDIKRIWDKFEFYIEFCIKQ